MLRPNGRHDMPDHDDSDAHMRLWDALPGIAVAIICLAPLTAAAFGPINRKGREPRAACIQSGMAVRIRGQNRSLLPCCMVRRT